MCLCLWFAVTCAILKVVEMWFKAVVVGFVLPKVGHALLCLGSQALRHLRILVFIAHLSVYWFTAPARPSPIWWVSQSFEKWKSWQANNISRVIRRALCLFRANLSLVIILGELFVQTALTTFNYDFYIGLFRCTMRTASGILCLTFPHTNDSAQLDWRCTKSAV